MSEEVMYTLREFAERIKMSYPKVQKEYKEICKRNGIRWTKLSGGAVRISAKDVKGVFDGGK